MIGFLAQFRRVSTVVLGTVFISSVTFAQDMDWSNEMISVHTSDIEHVIMGTQPLRDASWDQLPQPVFWQEIMGLSPDSSLINIGSTRQVVGRMSNKEWRYKGEAYRLKWKDSVRVALGLPAGERIMVTSGKNDFYRFDLVFESLQQGVAYFDEFGVDPWYAQSILLIESPGHMRKSVSGAYGAFQLMPSVAREMGLTVNKYVDERRDFKRSAYGAAMLLSRICIPSARSIAQSAGLVVNEQSVWFRLLVMHVYHAGAGNVRTVVNKIGNPSSGEELIRKMWITSAGKFGNESQNYTQLALAAQLQLAQIIQSKGHPVFKCTEFSQP